MELLRLVLSCGWIEARRCFILSRTAGDSKGSTVLASDLRVSESFGSCTVPESNMSSDSQSGR